MQKIILILAIVIFISGCSEDKINMNECIKLNITDSDYLVFSENLKSIGFEYAMEFQPAPPMKKEILNRIFYLDVNNVKVKDKLNFSLFRIIEKGETDIYAVEILIPYLVEHYGNFDIIETDYSTIFGNSLWNKGMIKAKVWELKDRRIYLLESFFDKSINSTLDLMFIEIK